MDRGKGGFDRARISIDAAQAVREAITAAKRPLAEVAIDRLSSVDADGSLWRQLADAIWAALG